MRKGRKGNVIKERKKIFEGANQSERQNRQTERQIDRSRRKAAFYTNQVRRQIWVWGYPLAQEKATNSLREDVCNHSQSCSIASDLEAPRVEATRTALRLVRCRSTTPRENPDGPKLFFGVLRSIESRPWRRREQRRRLQDRKIVRQAVAIRILSIGESI